MVTININNEKFEIPQRLTVEQYHAALQFDWADTKYYPMIVAQLIGISPHHLIGAAEESLTLAITFIINSMNKRKETKMVDLEAITFGQFIDCDVYLALGLDKHFKDLAEMIAPQTKWADEAMWAIDQYAAYRTYTYRQYKTLFGISDREVDTVATEEVTDKMAIARGWYKVIVSLAQDNILNIDAVTDQPLKKALNFMALQKEKIQEENQQKLKQKRQYDLQRSRY